MGGGASALLRFDLGTLPAGTSAAKLVKANLVLFVNRVGTPGAIELQTVNSPWSEATVTATSAPVTSGAGSGPNLAVNAALEFKNGKCVKATADKGLEYLQAMIDMDAGSSYLGELAFGVNYNITRYTRNTLFDEKIGGTVHVALGSGYPETGNRNQSGLHWDMVVDLRKGGKVFADGKLIQQDGRFLDKRFPQPNR